MRTTVIIDGNKYTSVEDTEHSKEEMSQAYYKSFGTVGATLATFMNVDDGSVLVLGHDATARAQWIFTD